MRMVSYGIAIAALSLTGSAVAAPVETVLYSFQGGSDGAIPLAGLIADNRGALQRRLRPLRWPDRRQ
jgi:hypothetical protein